VFNVFNHANYGLFNGVVGTATFGQPVQVLSTSFLPRVLQLAFKVAF
jgi:hypothetical protein